MLTAMPAAIPISSNCNVAFVAIQVTWRAVIGDEDVLPAVAVKVSDQRLQAVEIRRSLGYAACLCDVGKPTVSSVTEQSAFTWDHAPRPAEDARTLVHAVHPAAFRGEVPGINRDICGDVQIQKTIGIDIAKRRAGGPHSRTRDSRRLGPLLKPAVALVVEQKISAKAGDQDVGPSIVVVIGDGNAHAPSESRQAGLHGHIDKDLFSPIFVKSDYRIASLTKTLQGAAADQKDVEPSIAVVVDEGASAADGFDNIVFGRCALHVAKPREAGLFGNVHPAFSRSGERPRQCRPKRYRPCWSCVQKMYFKANCISRLAPAAEIVP